MNRRKERRFTIGDAMILVASSALGLALLRSTLVGSGLAMPSPQSPLLPTVQSVADRVMIFFTLGWAALRIRRPHPGRRIMLRRIGSAVGWAATGGVAVSLVFGTANFAFRPPHPDWWRNWHLISLFFFLRIIGPIVLGALSALLLSRRSRVGSGWIEGIGLGVGSYWAFWSVYGIIKPLLHHYFPTIG